MKYYLCNNFVCIECLGWHGLRLNTARFVLQEVLEHLYVIFVLVFSFKWRHVPGGACCLFLDKSCDLSKKNKIYGQNFIGKV